MFQNSPQVSLNLEMYSPYKSLRAQKNTNNNVNSKSSTTDIISENVHAVIQLKGAA